MLLPPQPPGIPDSMPNVLFLFLDESGDLTFSPSGTRYWALTALCTLRPAEGREAFIDLRYRLAADGLCLEYFHATEDRQSVRDEMFGLIRNLQGIEVHCVLADKPKANPSLFQKQIVKNGQCITVKDETRFYYTISRTLLKFIMTSYRFQRARRVVVIMSTLWKDGTRKNAVMKALKSYLEEEVNVPFELYFHGTGSHINCQIADYCGWAISIAWERGEYRSLDLIRNKVRSAFDIFRNGDRIYYRK